MRHRALVILFAAATAHADVTHALQQVLAADTEKLQLPRFAITNDFVDQHPTEWGSLLYPTNIAAGKLKQPVVGTSTDGDVGWIACEIAPSPCIRGALPDDTSGDSSYDEPRRCMWEQKGAYERVAFVAERIGAAWQPVAWHIYGKAPKFIAAASYDALKPAIADGARDAEKLFEASIADPKALAKTLSSRDYVVMLGSDRDERYVGAAAIAATLAKWNLSFKPRDGVVAGVAGKSVAWIAANLEAANLGKPKQPHTFYRALFVYEHAGATWQLVQASFSDLEPPK